MGAVLAWHGPENLDQRPAAYDDARHAELLAASPAIVDEDLAVGAHATDVARQAFSGPGRTQVGHQLPLIRVRSAARRAEQVAAQTAQFEAHLAARRGTPSRARDSQ